MTAARSSEPPRSATKASKSSAAGLGANHQLPSIALTTGVLTSSATKYERKQAKVASEAAAANLPGTKPTTPTLPEPLTTRQAWCPAIQKT
jgi:hypothetical protein